MFATALGCLLVVLSGFAALAVPDVTDAVAFVLVGAVIALTGEQLRRYRVRAATSAREAAAREAHLTSILDTVPDAMIVIDERGIMQFVQLGGRAAVRLHRQRKRWAAMSGC